MIALFRKKVQASEVGEQLCERAREERRAGYPQAATLLLPTPEMDVMAVRNEWLYLEIFRIDLAVRLAFGGGVEKSAILTAFWSGVKNWLLQQVVAPLAERRILLDGHSKIVPPENEEKSYSRLKRRLQLYSECSHVRHPLGEGLWIAATFIGLCGTPDGAPLGEITSRFTSSRDELARQLKSERIVV